VEPRRVTLGGLDVVFRLTGEETGGALAAVERPIEPGILVPRHLHEHEDELTYVLRARSARA
jgi:quercetin dioxygenase-like cupin family protein